MTHQKGSKHTGIFSVVIVKEKTLYRNMGHAVAQLIEALRYKPEGRGFVFPLVSLEFFIYIILSAAL
jgi:hypothetical protein